jgi:pyruvate dehydrogenase E2 component (dihydrolipoamide acetyltransferase)
MHGVSQVIPIINPPQAAILGVGRVRGIFRPDRAGAPHLRREMMLSLAADHRVLDGVAAAALLRRIIGHLEAPTPLLRAAIAR